MSRQFGRYELLAKIAAGGMAEVYLAVQRGPAGFEKRVALKVLLPQLAEEPEFIALFLDEARIAASLSHPNICQIYELGQEQGRHFIAMEFLEGQSLSRVLKKAARRKTLLPPALGAFAVGAAASGLGAAHEKTDPAGRPLGIVHRDVSPQNVMLTYDGEVKVVDFGIAHAAHRQSRTRTGEVRGKVAYMSPEQIEGRPLDGRSDVFALGALLFEVLTGQALFQGENDVRTMEAVLRKAVPEIEEKGGMPRGINAVLRGALARKPEERTPSARDFARQLQAVLRPIDPPPDAERLATFMRDLFREERAQDRLRYEAASSTNPGEFFLVTPREPSSPPTGKGGTVALRSVESRRSYVAPLAVLLVLGLGIAAGLGLRWRVRTQPSTGLSQAVLPPQPASHPAPTLPAPTLAGLPPVHPAGANPTAAAVRAQPEAAIVQAEPKPISRRSGSALLKRHQRSRGANVRSAAAKPEVTVGPRGPSGEPGTLTLDTYPWTDVYLDGKKLGTTPLVQVKLPAGHYRLRAVNADEKIDRAVEIDVLPHQNTARKFTW